MIKASLSLRASVVAFVFVVPFVLFCASGTRSQSLPQAGPPKGYVCEQIRGGLYWITDGAYSTMFLVTREGVIVVDAPPRRRPRRF